MDNQPIILVGACDIPDGKMPVGASRVVTKLLSGGCSVRSTYAVALVPDVLRAGERCTITRESLAVRFRCGPSKGWMTWESDGAAWGSKSRWAVIGGRAVSFALTRSKKMAHDAYTLDEVIADLRDGTCSAPEIAEIPTPERAKPDGRYLGRWVTTGTQLGQVYPCRCLEPVWAPRRWCGDRCPCWGRMTGTEFTPAECCARRQLGTMPQS